MDVVSGRQVSVARDPLLHLQRQQHGVLRSSGDSSASSSAWKETGPTWTTRVLSHLKVRGFPISNGSDPCLPHNLIHSLGSSFFNPLALYPLNRQGDKQEID